MLRVKDKIESILLYDKSYPIFDGPEISSYLNFVFEKANIRFQVSQQGDDRSFILLAANGGFFVLISQNRSALGPNGFSLPLPHQLDSSYFQNWIGRLPAIREILQLLSVRKFRLARRATN